MDFPFFSHPRSDGKRSLFVFLLASARPTGTECAQRFH